MDRRKFLTYVGCGCGSLLLHSCSSAPITDRKQLKIIPEAKLNAQAAQIYEKVKKKEKLSKDTKTLNLIKEIGRMSLHYLLEPTSILIGNLIKLHFKVVSLSIEENFGM